MLFLCSDFSKHLLTWNPTVIDSITVELFGAVERSSPLHRSFTHICCVPLHFYVSDAADPFWVQAWIVTDGMQLVVDRATRQKCAIDNRPNMLNDDEQTSSVNCDARAFMHVMSVGWLNNQDLWSITVKTAVKKKTTKITVRILYPGMRQRTQKVNCWLLWQEMHFAWDVLKLHIDADIIKQK
jgi:hypothetical protein